MRRPRPKKVSSLSLSPTLLLLDLHWQDRFKSMHNFGPVRISHYAAANKCLQAATAAALPCTP